MAVVLENFENRAPYHVFYIACAHLQCCMPYGSFSSSTQKELAWCMPGDREDQTNKEEAEEESFQHKNPFKKKKRKRDEPWHWLHTVPVQFALFPVTCPCHQKGSHWGPYWGHLSLPWPPFSPQPLKSCTAMCMALMFALYPTCKAIIIHASWQSQALSLLHLQLFALGYDMTVRLISSLLHIAPCVSLSFCFSALRLCTMFESNSDLTT